MKCNYLDAVRRNPLTSKSTDAEIEKQIKLWLRNACDRNGGRNERSKKALLKKQAASVV